MTPSASQAVADGGFADMRAAFLAASAACPAETSTRCLRLLDRTVRLSSVGAGLTAMLDTAFAHLVDADPMADGDACIEVWDRAAAPVAVPRPVPSDEWLVDRADATVATYGNFRYIREERANSVIWLDRDDGRVVAAFDDAGRALLLEKARPFNHAMTEICRRLGGQAIHAAMAGQDGRGILIVGASGRGKSTTAVDCLACGLDFLGDDAVAITGDGGAAGFVGHSLYASAQIHPTQFARWPHLLRHWSRPGPDDLKALLLPIPALGGRLPRSLPIAAIVVPCARPGPVTIRPASGAEAFHALVFDSTENRRFVLRRDQFDQFARLTRSVPSFHMQVGADPDAVADGCSRILGGRA